MIRTDQERGATLQVVALLLPVLILMTAFAVDLGRQRSSRRTMQARADIVALDLVRLTDGRTEAEIVVGGGGQPSAAAALIDAAARNEVDPAQLTVEWGTWTQASGFIPTTDAGIPNAVEVTAVETTEYFFQPGSGEVERSAVASTGEEPMAGFSIGSFGAALDPASAGLLNSLLTPLLGSPVGLNALSYQGLATATLGVADLGAELGLLTPNEVLDTEIGVDEAILAAAEVLRRNGDAANATILEGLITPEIEAMPPITLGQLVQAEQGGESAALDSQIDALGLLTTSAFLSQCTDPADLGSCSGLAVPALSSTLPGVTTTGSLRVIQGVASAYGPVGASARTSQVAADVGVTVGAQNVGACVPRLANLFCLVNGLLVGAVDATVTVDASIQLADGRGQIAAIECGGPLGLDVSTRTGLYEIQVDVRVDFGRRGVLGGVLGPLLGSLEFTFSNLQSDVFDLAQFDVPPDVLGVTTEQTGAGDIGLTGLALSNVGGAGVLGQLGGLGITQTLGGVLNTLVNPVLTLLDSQVLGPLTDLLGVNVVGSDITPQRIDCDDTTVKLVG
jgi:uncharacterized membrane protein